MTQQKFLCLPLIFLMAVSCAPKAVTDKHQKQIEAINEYMDTNTEQAAAAWTIIAKLEAQVDRHEADLADMSLQINTLKTLCEKQGKK